MVNQDHSVAKSLTADTTELLPYIPYLLQDIFELGSSPKDMIELVKNHVPIKVNKVLDLGCGKGAVSIAIAKALGAEVKGFDLMSAFIAEAEMQAIKEGVHHHVEFKIKDIHLAIEEERNYDLVIYGALGDVLGPPEILLDKLKHTVHNEGYILIDDAYGQSGIQVDYYTKSDWLKSLSLSSLELVAEKFVPLETLEELNRVTMQSIQKRVEELKAIYPDKARLFESYRVSQQAECDTLETSIQGVTMLIRHNDRC